MRRFARDAGAHDTQLQSDDQITRSGVNTDQCPNMEAALECPITKHEATGNPTLTILCERSGG